MKKVLLTLLIIGIILSSSLAFAQPFLACDPDPNVSEYIVELDGVEYPASPAIDVRPDATIIVDLDGMITYQTLHTIRVKAVNIWNDESEWTLPFEFMVSSGGGVTVRQIPNTPNVLRLISE